MLSDSTLALAPLAKIRMGEWAMNFVKHYSSDFKPAESPPLTLIIAYNNSLFNSLQNNIEW
jgi:hypothetical protein